MNKLRKYVSLILVFAFIILTWTGIMLYIAPHGRVANWTNWKIMSASKSDFERMHTIWGYIMVILSLLHIYLNWNSIKMYIKKKKSNFISKEFIISLLIVAVLFVLIRKNVGPVKLIMNIGEKASNSWEKKALSSPPVPHAETMSINELSKYIDYSGEEILNILKNAGIEVNSTEDIIEDIARNNNMSPAKMYEIINKSKGNGRHGNGSKSSYEEDRPSIGYGQMTLNELCEYEHIDIDKAIAKLKENNIDANRDDNLRDIADKYNMHPRDIKDLISE